jgi:hypothetical protein
MTKEMAKLLVLAQAGSDEGKNISRLSELLPKKLYEKAAWSGYVLKDSCIYELVQLIRRYPQKDIHFFICKDEQKVAKYIVYFDIVFAGKRRQISFHSFDSRLKHFLRGSRKSHVEWACWESSRENAYELGRYYGFVQEADFIY